MTSRIRAARVRFRAISAPSFWVIWSDRQRQRNFGAAAPNGQLDARKVPPPDDTCPAQFKGTTSAAAQTQAGRRFSTTFVSAPPSVVTISEARGQMEDAMVAAADATSVR